MPDRARPDYDVKNATGVYAGMAGTLSGFAFTAIVLLIREVPAVCDPDCQSLRQRALVALVVGFIGCGISGFAFGVVAAERDHRRRLRAAFFAGNGFIVALAHLLWAVAVLTHLFLTAPKGDVPHVRVALASSLGAIGTYILAPLFLLLAARAFEKSWSSERSVGASTNHDRENPSVLGDNPWVHLWSFLTAPILLVAGVASWGFAGSALTDWSAASFDWLSAGSGVLIVAMGIFTLVGVMARTAKQPASSNTARNPASSYYGLMWCPVIVTSVILACLIILLPK